MDGPLRSPPSFYPYGVHMRSRKSFRLPLKLLLLPLMIVAFLSCPCLVLFPSYSSPHFPFILLCMSTVSTFIFCSFFIGYSCLSLLSISLSFPQALPISYPPSISSSFLLFHRLCPFPSVCVLSSNNRFA